MVVVVVVVCQETISGMTCDTLVCLSPIPRCPLRLTPYRCWRLRRYPLANVVIWWKTLVKTTYYICARYRAQKQAGRSQTHHIKAGGSTYEHVRPLRIAGGRHLGDPGDAVCICPRCQRHAVSEVDSPSCGAESENGVERDK